MSERERVTHLVVTLPSAAILSHDQVRHIFVEIAQGRGEHGGFLRSIAEAVMRADPSNMNLVLPTAMCLIVKYDLARYLDNYVPWPPIGAAGTEST